MANNNENENENEIEGDFRQPCKMRPFQLWCKQNFPFIEDTFEALDFYGLMCKLKEYLNQVIENLNINEDNISRLNDNFIKLNNYVNEYFNNLDVQNEINTKLDEMATDGTLDKIINQNIFNNLNNQIDNLNTEVEKITKFPNFYVGAFFSGGFGAVDRVKANFKCSLDGVNFTEFNSNTNINNNYWLKDISLQYDKPRKRFLLSSTQYSNDMDCLIYTSNDFVNWNEYKINLGYLVPHDNLHRWAPDLFVDDDGSIYLNISIETKRENSTTYFKQVLYKCTDPDTLTFEKVGDIKLSDDNDNYIDGSFAKYNNVYYFIVKVELKGILQLYSTNNIENVNSYILINDYVNFEDLSLEGPCLCFTDETLNIYAENYAFFHGYSMQQTQLKDFPNIPKNTKWLYSLTNNQYTTAPENFDARHGTVLYISDEEAKKIILNNTNINFSDTSAIKIDDKVIDFDFYYNNNPKTVIVYPNCKYSLGNIGGNITIDNLINPYNCSKVIFLQSTNPLTLTINKINGVEKKLIYKNNGSNKGNVTILDLDSGRFLQPYDSITLDDITNNLSDVANITLCNGYNYNGIVFIDFVIKLNKTITKRYAEIAILPDRFRPIQYCMPNHYILPDQEIFISGNGTIAINLAGNAGTGIRCTACYFPNN